MSMPAPQKVESLQDRLTRLERYVGVLIDLLLDTHEYSAALRQLADELRVLKE
jgi:hypothetical protein